MATLSQVEHHQALRERLVDATSELIAEVGWSRVTMGRLAERVGVSRQTVYNEIGAKPQLAETVIAVELERFLAVVSAAFDASPTDLTKAVRKSCRAVLERAQDNQVLHAVVSATHGADTDLLPFLTTHAQPLLEACRAVIRARVVSYEELLTQRQVEALIDMVVRTVLSQVMQPSGSPRATADDLAWIVESVLVAERGRRADDAVDAITAVPAPRGGD
ncbi:TetR/AcrR family transcriptional regulator [Nocardioides insulae]|uniref:TetR/AcrR family transcriptional regulator n=1 Tax=Nocardioides insulae TaxID=394734 RepID=UPI000415CD26|nr:TetR family transcriptional regulator [Nocardioides insulae]